MGGAAAEEGGAGLGEICCGSKFGVCLACQAQRRATRERGGEREGKTCCFHVPKPCSRPPKTSVFTQVGSLGTISVRKKGVKERKEKKKKATRGIKGCSPPF